MSGLCLNECAVNGQLYFILSKQLTLPIESPVIVPNDTIFSPCLKCYLEYGETSYYALVGGRNVYIQFTVGPSSLESGCLVFLHIKAGADISLDGKVTLEEFKLVIPNTINVKMNINVNNPSISISLSDFEIKRKTLDNLLLNPSNYELIIIESLNSISYPVLISAKAHCCNGYPQYWLIINFTNAYPKLIKKNSFFVPVSF